MDCKKIGKYIKIKRMRVGLTQDELGDKLGVTGKAVSKWECGVALPDISLFNMLSEILQIEVSELLNGEDNKEKDIDYKNKRLNYRLMVIIFALLICIVFLGKFFINNFNKVHVYDVVSTHNDFYVEGKLIIIKDESYLSISDVRFVEGKYNPQLNVRDFRYQLIYKDKVLYNYEFTDKENVLSFYFKYIDFFVEIKEKNSDLFLRLKLEYFSDNNEKYIIPLKLVK